MWWQVRLRSSSQPLVLIFQASNLGQTLDHSTAGNHLVWCELLTDEVHLDPAPQAGSACARTVPLTRPGLRRVMDSEPFRRPRKALPRIRLPLPPRAERPTSRRAAGPPSYGTSPEFAASHLLVGECVRSLRGVASGVAVEDLTQSCGEGFWLTRVAKLATEEAPVMARELGQRLIQRLGRRRRGAPGHRGS